MPARVLTFAATDMVELAGFTTFDANAATRIVGGSVRGPSGQSGEGAFVVDLDNEIVRSAQFEMVMNPGIYWGKGLHATVFNASLSVWLKAESGFEVLLDRVYCDTPGAYGDYWPAGSPVSVKSYVSPLSTVDLSDGGDYRLVFRVDPGAVVDLASVKLSLVTEPMPAPTWPDAVARAVRAAPSARSQVNTAIQEALIDEALSLRAAQELQLASPLMQTLDRLAQRALETTFDPAEAVRAMTAGLVPGRSFAQAVGFLARQAASAATDSYASLLRTANPMFDLSEALGQTVLRKLGAESPAATISRNPSLGMVVRSFVKEAMALPAPAGASSAPTTIRSVARLGDHVLEVIAKTEIYTDHAEGTSLMAGGVSLTVIKEFKDPISGAYALLLQATSGERLVAIRGTEVTDLADLRADFDTRGVGYSQYLALRPVVRGWVASSPRGSVSFTGHSLGGAVVQWLISDLTRSRIRVGDAVTFNSAGISSAAARAVNVQMARVVRHYQTAGDVVGRVGQAFVAGEVVIANTAGSFIRPMLGEGVRLVNLHLERIYNDDGTPRLNIVFESTPVTRWARVDSANPPLHPIYALMPLLATSEGAEASRELIANFAQAIRSLTPVVSLPAPFAGITSVADLQAAISENVASLAATWLVRDKLAGLVNSALLDVGTPRELAGYATRLVIDIAETRVREMSFKLIQQSGLAQPIAAGLMPLVDQARSVLGAINQTAVFQAISSMGNVLTLASQIAQVLIPSPRTDLERFARSIVFIPGQPLISVILTGVNFVESLLSAKASAKARRLAESTIRDKTVTAYLLAFFENAFAKGDPETQSLINEAHSDLNNSESEHRGDRQYFIALRAAQVYARQIKAGTVYIPSGSEALPYIPSALEDGVAIGQQIMFGVIFSGMDIALTSLTGKSAAAIWADISADTDPASMQAGLAALINSRWWIGTMPEPLPAARSHLALVVSPRGVTIGQTSVNSNLPGVAATISPDSCPPEDAVQLVRKVTQLSQKLGDVSKEITTLVSQWDRNLQYSDADLLRDTVKRASKVITESLSRRVVPWQNLQSADVAPALRYVADRWLGATAGKIVDLGILVRKLYEIARLMEEIRLLHERCPSMPLVPFVAPSTAALEALSKPGARLGDVIRFPDLMKWMPPGLAKVAEVDDAIRYVANRAARGGNLTHAQQLLDRLNVLDRDLPSVYAAGDLMRLDGQLMSSAAAMLQELYPGINLLVQATLSLDGAPSSAIALAIDEDSVTAITANWQGNNGGHGGTVTLVATFQSLVSINEIVLDASAFGFASGRYIRNFEASMSMEYLDGQGQWHSIPGTNHSTSGGDGSGAVGVSGRFRHLAIQGARAIRVVLHGFGNSSGGEGQAGGRIRLSTVAVFGMEE